MFLYRYAVKFCQTCFDFCFFFSEPIDSLPPYRRIIGKEAVDTRFGVNGDLATLSPRYDGDAGMAVRCTTGRKLFAGSSA